MRIPCCYPLILAFMLMVEYGSAQNNTIPSPSEVMQNVLNTVDGMDSCHYLAQMHTQHMGSDTFDTRNFVINFRRNADNMLYGYDWEIGEWNTNGTFTFMIVPGFFYRIVSSAMVIIRNDMLSRFEPGEYFLTMHEYFILDQVIMPFRIGTDDHTTMTETEDAFQLTRQMNELAKRDLLVNKKSFLPVKSVSTITDGALDLKQVITIEFTFPLEYNQLPDSAFFPEYYTSKGYELKTFETETPNTEEREFTFDEIKEALLLSYAFMTEVGDTVRIIDVQSKYVLLDFWYASCLPCLKAMPHINRLAERYHDDGLLVIGVNCFDKDMMTELMPKIKAKNISMPQIFGERELMKALGMNRFPTYILISPGNEFQIINGSPDEIEVLLSAIFDK